MTGAIHAGIDCGTNSIRLLVARLDGDRLVDLDRRMLTIRLGEGLDESGVISGAALDRAAAACDEYSQVLAGYEVSGLRFVATSASRDAENATTFTDLVQRHLHVLPEVIDGGQEAALSFLGARRSLDVAEPTMVVDIGGGSTEFVRGGSDRSGGSVATSVVSGCTSGTDCRRCPPWRRWQHCVRTLRFTFVRLPGPWASRGSGRWWPWRELRPPWRRWRSGCRSTTPRPSMVP